MVRTSGVPSRTILRNVKPNSTFSSLFLASLEGRPLHQIIMLPILSRRFLSLHLFTGRRGKRASRKCSVLLSAGTVPEEGNM